MIHLKQTPTWAFWNLETAVRPYELWMNHRVRRFSLVEVGHPVELLRQNLSFLRSPLHCGSPYRKWPILGLDETIARYCQILPDSDKKTKPGDDDARSSSCSTSCRFTTRPAENWMGMWLAHGAAWRKKYLMSCLNMSNTYTAIQMRCANDGPLLGHPLLGPAATCSMGFLCTAVHMFKQVKQN